jgi:hypothetical protein
VDLRFNFPFLSNGLNTTKKKDWLGPEEDEAWQSL